MNKLPIIAIVGETASGKSALAEKVALEFDGEIIAADSRTVYKGMDIGTAKPNEQIRQNVVYHCLDIITPDQTFSAADFKKIALQKIHNIRRHGKMPIIVGGSGLYVDSVIFDYSFSPVSDPTYRRHLNNLDLEELQNIALENEIYVSLDMLKNKRHLIRSLERGSYQINDNKLINNTVVVGIKIDRRSLRNNIESRVEAMFKAGLRKEVDSLVKQHGWQYESMSGIGYREFRKWYDGEISMMQVKRNIVKNTLKLAKRQRTWFKKNLYITWFDDTQAAYDFIADRLKRI